MRNAEKVRRRDPDQALLETPEQAIEGVDRSRLPSDATGSADRARLLCRTIETEVVPRLVLVHREPQRPGRARTPPIRARDIASLTSHVLTSDTGAAEGVIDAVRIRGATLEHVALDLMAPAARRLGDLWMQDDCTYTDVTVGVWRLQGLLRGLSPVFQPQLDPARGHMRRAMIVTMPGEGHAFGTDMVSGFLRLSGWEVCNEPVATAEELTRRVQRDSITVVGLSCGCGDDLPTIAALISAVRRAAGSRQVGIMVGGQIFTNEPQSALILGADAVAFDARHAVRQAEGLLKLLGLTH